MAAVRNCIFSLQNQLDSALVLIAQSGATDGDRGTWDPPPPATLAPGQSANATLVTGRKNSGSSGWLTYALASDNSQTITFRFRCPDGESNSASYTSTVLDWAAPFVATVGDEQESNRCPRSGQPLALSFTLGYRLQSMSVAGACYPLIADNGMSGVPTKVYNAPGVDAQFNLVPAQTNPGMFTACDASATLSAIVLNDMYTLDGFSMSASVAGCGPDAIYTGAAAAAPTSSTSTVTLSLSSPAGLNGLAFSLVGNFSYQMTPPKGAVFGSGTIPLELYYVIGSPANFWANGVWIRFLRAIFKTPGCLWPANAAGAGRNAVALCFGGFNSAYDYTYADVMNYERDGKFMLFNLLSGQQNNSKCASLGPTVNGLDQTNFVACVLSALGIPTYRYKVGNSQYVAKSTPIALVQKIKPFYTVHPHGPRPIEPRDPCFDRWTPSADFVPWPIHVHHLAGIQVGTGVMYLDACLGPWAGTLQGYQDLFYYTSIDVELEDTPQPISLQTVTTWVEPPEPGRPASRCASHDGLEQETAMASVRNCIFSLCNQLDTKLVLTAQSGAADGDRGTWDPPPPASILPGQTVSATLVTGRKNSGSSGWLTYSAVSDNAQAVTFSFRCPDGNSNSASYTSTVPEWAAPFVATVGDEHQANRCPRSGQPLALAFTLGYRLQSMAVAGARYPVVADDGLCLVPAQVYTAPYVDAQGLVHPAQSNPGLFTACDASATLAATVLNDMYTLEGFDMSASVVACGPDYLYAGAAPAAPTGSTSTVMLSLSSPTGLAGTTFSMNGQFAYALTSPSGTAFSGGTTPIELYYAMGSPANYWANGVWIRFLRAIFRTPGCTWPADASGAGRNAVTLCFGGFNEAYKYSYFNDTDHVRDNTFALFNLLSGTTTGYCGHVFGPTVNCVDQANFVACVLSALGIPTYLYFTPSWQYVDESTPIGLVQKIRPYYTTKPGEPLPSPVPIGVCFNPWVPSAGFVPGPFRGHYFAGIHVGEDVMYLDACLGPWAGNLQGYQALFLQPITVEPAVSTQGPMCMTTAMTSIRSNLNEPDPAARADGALPAPAHPAQALAQTS